jgi:pimeloyl-ACP methyl ester carboxylesterase
MTEQRLSVPAPGGRELEVIVAGRPGGRPLVFHNGTPGGLVAYGPMAALAADHGMALVMYARPGYGRSTPQPGRTVADAAADTAAVLDYLEAGPFLTAGWSGGGPHALACAALLPGRCLAAATLAGVAPYRAADLNWLAGMGEENIQEFGAAVAGPATLEAMLSALAPELRGLTAGQITAGMGGLLSDADRSALAGGFAEYLAASMQAGLEAGIAGWRDDDLAFVADWGFSVTALADGPVPLSIWQGGQDLMVPGSHGAWLAGQLPGARTHLLPAAGHLTLPAATFGEILDELEDMTA